MIIKTLFQLLVAVFSLLVALPVWAGQLVVDILDVGQGDAILISTDEKTVLIDAADRHVDLVDQLKLLGVETLDLVVGTHAHADHIGRMEDVLRTFDVKLYMDSGLPHTTAVYSNTMAAVEDEGIPYKTAKGGTILNLGDEAIFTVLSPPPEGLLSGTRSDLNSNSVVLLLEHEDISFLFTGDAEEPTEHYLLQTGIGEVDVLKVAHHGSGHSSTLDFLEVVHPDVGLISVGEGNRYKHPYPECLERLDQVGAQVYRTDLSGHLRVISDGSNFEVFEGRLEEILGIDFVEGPVVVDETPDEEEPPDADTPPAESKKAAKLARKAEKLRKKAEKLRRKAELLEQQARELMPK
ncbi:MAG: MBL fold metallo-hydrolase [Proteobacteria bacterium]|jgi:competence protein ComEC|nr:MBL fold metallo-hydrolase [Pseudomonadota bacterium]